MPDFLARLEHLLPVAEAVQNFLGVSAPMVQVERTLQRLARVNSTVLFTGETGVGKEVAARYLHGQKGDGPGPFMAVNCAAIPAELMEAELFGHERGAFTGAGQRHAGYAERAGTGVLFLDEVGELALPLQAKLLRLLEDRTFIRVGGERVLSFGARVMAASNVDLEARVREGRFREDLFYRINVIEIAIPPLRERPDDIAWLLDRFTGEFIQAFDADVAGVSALAEEAALTYAWPGNVRELRNRVERAVALALGPWILPGDLFPSHEPVAVGEAPLASLEEARQAAERRHIQRALALTGGEIAATARTLGISRTTLWEKMRRLGLSGDGPKEARSDS
jgi:DNA-binding NtrC family response regulator